MVFYHRSWTVEKTRFVVIFLKTLGLMIFLAVQDSSIGDIVTESVSQSLSHF